MQHNQAFKRELIIGNLDTSGKPCHGLSVIAGGDNARFVAKFVPNGLDQAVDTGDFADNDARLHGIAR